VNSTLQVAFRILLAAGVSGATAVSATEDGPMQRRLLAALRRVELCAARTRVAALRVGYELRRAGRSAAEALAIDEAEPPLSPASVAESVRRAWRLEQEARRNAAWCESAVGANQKRSAWMVPTPAPALPAADAPIFAWVKSAEQAAFEAEQAVHVAQAAAGRAAVDLSMVVRRRGEPKGVAGR
jgi:hypothetical protein